MRKFLSKYKSFGLLGILLLNISTLAIGCAQENKLTTPDMEVDATASPVTEIENTQQEVHHLDLQKDFITKAVNTYKGLSYHGYAKVIKEGNSFRFIFINEDDSARNVDIGLHYKDVWMDIQNKEINTLETRRLPMNNSEYVDLNDKKINVLFAEKCKKEYVDSVSSDIDKYSVYDYLKITKEGYNIEVVYGGELYNRTLNTVDEEYFKDEYRLNFESEKCDRVNLTNSLRINSPKVAPTPSPSPSI